MQIKNVLKTGFLAATMMFAANDGVKAQNLVAFNDVSAPKIEVNDNTPKAISEGTVGEAMRSSAKNEKLVIHVSGGTQDKYKAEQYAQMFKVMFNDPKRTKFPTEVSVLFTESGKDRPTGVYAFLNGMTFDKNGGGYFDGDGVFTAPEIVQWIPKITEQYATKTGVVSLENDQANTPKVVMN